MSMISRWEMSLEGARWKTNALPPWLVGSILRKGMADDIIVSDLDKLGMLGEAPVCADVFPGGERRLIQKSVGLHHILLVNKVETLADGPCTGALPGKLLRSTDIAA